MSSSLGQWYTGCAPAAGRSRGGRGGRGGRGSTAGDAGQFDMTCMHHAFDMLDPSVLGVGLCLFFLTDCARFRAIGLHIAACSASRWFGTGLCIGLMMCMP